MILEMERYYEDILGNSNVIFYLVFIKCMYRLNNVKKILFIYLNFKNNGDV